MTIFSPIKFEEHVLAKYVSLFSTCFPKSDKYSERYLRWLYCENPIGPAVGYDAWDGDALAAHYVCIPVLASIGGEVVKVLISLNTATHPTYQGKGLFTQLAERTYASGADEGYDCVYGVANANSTPGFVRKLGFQLIEPLQALVGFGSLDIDFKALASNVHFERAWTSDTLTWRCANPANPIRRRRCHDVEQFHASGIGNLLPAYAELSTHCAINTAGSEGQFLSPFRLFLGLLPDDTSKFHRYVNIPQRFRPSPLNFIYRSLSSRMRILERGRVSLSFLDFDAY